MNTKIAILAVLVFSVFLVGCTQSQSGNYAGYNQPQGQPQGGQYVGGGCGVAPSGNYQDTPVQALTRIDSGL